MDAIGFEVLILDQVNLAVEVLVLMVKDMLYDRHAMSRMRVPLVEPELDTAGVNCILHGLRVRDEPERSLLRRLTPEGEGSIPDTPKL